MNKKKLKMKYVRLIIVSLFTSFMMQAVIYAEKNPYTRIEFDRPEAEESKYNKSESAIIKNSPYQEYTPINPVPVGVDKEEYDSVDNYDIDLKTLETRIKYFSPTYLSIKKSAESSYWMSLYARGGSVPNMTGFYDSQKELLDTAEEYKKKRDEKKQELSDYKKNNETPVQSVIDDYMTEIDTYDTYYRSYKSGYTTAVGTINATMKSLGYRKTLSQIADVDSNTQIKFARESVVKALSSLVLTYKQLEKTMKVLSGQEELYKKIYETYLKNYNEGLATALDVSTQLHNYENAKATRESLYTTFINVKQQLCINLGYSIDDIDKIKVKEPEVDFDYINNINIDNDRDMAYNSNSTYKAITLSDKDKKLPGSTGDEIYNNRRKSTAEKVIVALESAYCDLQAALLTYKGCEFLKEACKLNVEANKRKKENNLVSDTEYFGLEIQNLASELQVYQAKYDLINAANNYYYGTLGQLTIS